MKTILLMMLLFTVGCSNTHTVYEVKESNQEAMSRYVAEMELKTAWSDSAIREIALEIYGSPVITMTTDGEVIHHDKRETNE